MTITLVLCLIGAASLAYYASDWRNMTPENRRFHLRMAAGAVAFLLLTVAMALALNLLLDAIHK